jgi:hypothetical protein
MEDGCADRRLEEKILTDEDKEERRDGREKNDILK